MVKFKDILESMFGILLKSNLELHCPTSLLLKLKPKLGQGGCPIYIQIQVL
jgi:hypothetical protein